MSQIVVQPIAEPVTLNYEADLCGNIEQALKGLQGYGIMALELIQNADDAHAKVLTFDARTDGLFVKNDASFSTCGLASAKCTWERTGDPEGLRRPCNFHAISKMGGRSKIHAAEQIGRFGIGFVSVYQITDTPIIRSSGTKLLLNPLTGEAWPRLIQEFEGTELELPWASSPSDIRDALNASPTPANVASKLVEEVTKILPTSLLFLRHLKRVEVRQDGIQRLSVTIERDGAGVTLVFGPEGRSERWMVLSRNASDLIERENLLTRYDALSKLDRSPIISVAIPVRGGPMEGLLYAYLPTKQETGMPLHVNADFFPHASRQDIVLSGEGHERYWNETLLAAAAATIGENFGLLREALGHSRLWEIGRAAFQLRESGAFSKFWGAFSEAAKATTSVWTTGDEWCLPGEIHMAPEQLIESEQTAVSSIGIPLLHPTLRAYWTELSSVGVTELRLSTIVDSLEALGEDGVAADDPNLRSLWTAIATMIELSRKRAGFDAVIKRLKLARFLIDLDGQPVSPVEVWRIPEAVPAARVRRYISDCPIVHGDVMRHSPIAEIIDEYGLYELASEVASAIKDTASAEERIGTAPDDVRGFYTLLTCFPATESGTKAGRTLADTPILRTSTRFVTPSRGQLPGGFRDPIGHFEFVDASLFTPGMQDFARDILGVKVLSFREYIDDHLEDILSSELTRQQYLALLNEIVEHRNELGDQGSLELLAEKSFIRTRSGNFVRPDECYYWSATLEKLLGEDAARWVDESWMPAPPIGSRLRDLLESRMDMPPTVSARHIVDRIEEIASHSTPEEVAEAITPILRHVIERWARFSDNDIETLAELQNLDFLPAQLDGERDDETLYSPDEVYRAGRAAGFASQVPVVDLTPLRQTGAAVTAFLDLLKMPSEPPTGDVVAHLQHCMESDVAVSDLTYAILNERLEREDGLADIDQLAGTTFIFHADLERYLPADRVFWRRPPFGGYWHTASNRMRQRESLYRRLGVEDDPTSSNYSSLLEEIARKPDRTEQDLAIHAQCLGYLAEALERGDAGVEEVIDDLRNNETLVNVDGEPLWPEEAIWVDSGRLATPFGDALNERLVRQPNVHRSAAARLFRRLRAAAISEVAHLRLASEPDNRAAPEETDRLRERGDLLLWLAPNPASRLELQRILKSIEIRLTETLRVQAEITGFDPPVRSRTSPVAAFYDNDGSVLHIMGSGISSNEWAAAFRVLLSEIERHCFGSDVKPLVTTASLVMLLPSHEEAEKALRQSDFRPPAEDADIPLGEELSDFLGEVSSDTGGDESEQEISSGGASDASYRLDAIDAAADDLAVGQASGAWDADDEVESGDRAQSPRAGSGARASREHGTDEAGEYKSKSGGNAFGSEPEDTAGPGMSREGRTDRETSGVTAPSKARGEKRGETSRERQVRRSRMLAYVAKAGTRGADDSEYGRSNDDVSTLIDSVAIAAALRYEETRGWTPQEQPHGNPGYDIISTSPEGKRRLIEVKGLEEAWTERGIKLSHVQFNMAADHPDEYWIYVIEHARDLERQRVSAIGSPFSKVEEYWFDHNWRDTREETAGGLELNVRIGAKVKHQIWDVGTITGVERRGLATYVKIDFGFQGVKYVPYSSDLKIVA